MTATRPINESSKSHNKHKTLFLRGLLLLAAVWFGATQSRLAHLSASGDDTTGGIMLSMSMTTFMSQQKQHSNAHPSQLTHVVIPFHESQLGKLSHRLQLWLPPCDENYHYNKNKPTLVFHVSFSPKQSKSNWEQVQNDVQRTVKKKLSTLARQCFDGDPIVVSQQLTGIEDTYLEGSRNMIEALLQGQVVQINGQKNNKKNNRIVANRTMISKPAQYILYMEPDVVTLRPGWLQRIAEEVASTSTTSRFWMMGSIYRGKYGPFVQKTFMASRPMAKHYHINGNAIYNLQTMHQHDSRHGGGFPQFYLDTLIPYVANKTRVQYNGKAHAYDADIHDYLLDPRNYETAREVLPYFRYTPLIQNLWHTKWSAAEVAQEHPETVLVHGGTNLDDPVFHEDKVEDT